MVDVDGGRCRKETCLGWESNPGLLNCTVCGLTESAIYHYFGGLLVKVGRYQKKILGN
jgi:hypothetical protein